MVSDSNSYYGFVWDRCDGWTNGSSTRLSGSYGHSSHKPLAVHTGKFLEGVNAPNSEADTASTEGITPTTGVKTTVKRVAATPGFGAKPPITRASTAKATTSVARARDLDAQEGNTSKSYPLNPREILAYLCWLALQDRDLGSVLPGN